jgi:hypothetical protein
VSIETVTQEVLLILCLGCKLIMTPVSPQPVPFDFFYLSYAKQHVYFPFLPTEKEIVPNMGLVPVLIKVRTTKGAFVKHLF